MDSLQFLVQTFGPTGVLVFCAVSALRVLVPAVQKYLENQSNQLTRIADAVKTIESIQAAVSAQLAEVHEDLDGVKLDIARIYEVNRQDQPSRTRPKPPRPVAQERTKP